MARILALVSLSGLLLSLAAHLAALSGIDVAAKVPAVWALHVGIFVVFGPFILASRKVLGLRPGYAQMRELFPPWIVALGTMLFVYVIVNFVLFLLATQGGNPAIHDGKFVLQEHGRLVREITQAEYTAFRANEVRGFSGHWLLFYFIPFAYFGFARPSGARA